MEMEDGCTAGFDLDALEEIKMFNHIEEFSDDAVVGTNYNDEVAQCTNEDKACHIEVYNMDMLGVGANNYVPTQTSAADAQCNDNDKACADQDGTQAEQDTLTSMVEAKSVNIY
ncbi:uncharacterized protein DS421_13g414360 [Arachis hypogaea]|nr:uncharacterized protein DS421_13g414360 [Arachis hypogaea]